MLGLCLSEAIGDLLEALAHRLPMCERLFEAKLLEVIADDFLAQESRCLFILFEEGIFVIGAKDLPAMFDAFEHVLPLARDGLAQFLLAEENGHTVGRQKIEAQFAGALEDGANGPVALENEVAAIFDLHTGIDAVQASTRQTFCGRKLWSDDERPVIDSLLQCFSVELIGGFLQSLGISNGKKAIILFAERNFLAAQLALNEIVAIEIGGDLEGQEGTHAQDHRAGDLVQNVEVIMRVAALVLAQELKVGVFGGEFWGYCAKRPALFHALKDVIDPKAVFPGHALLPGANQIFFANAFLRPEQRQLVVAGVMLDPGLIVAGSLGENLLGDFRLFADLPEKIGRVVFAGQKGQVSIDDDAIEAVIKPLQIRLKKFKKELPGRPFLEFVFCYSNFRKGSHALQEHEPAQQFY